MPFMSIRAKIAKIRFALRGLNERDIDPDPIAQFHAWFDVARRSGIELPEAVALATATSAGVPSARMLLLKGADSAGFRFFTNFESRKCGEMAENDRVALLFHWAELARQVRVEGRVEKLPTADAEAYFRTRPRGSQVGAWASRQSAELSSRAELEDKMAEYERKYSGKDVPLPPFWGGYLVRPERIEFWQGRADRLHDRFLYVREEDAWRVVRLSP
jgi:pyridoxamine 5'-phosphate oxidase